MLNLSLLLDVVVIIALTALSVIALLGKGYTQKKNILFALFSFVVGVWIVANYIGNDIKLSPDIAAAANYVIFPASFMSLLIIMFFIATLANLPSINKATKILLPFLVGIAMLGATPLVASGVVLQENVYAVTFGPLVGLFGVGIFTMVIIIFVALFQGLKKTKGTEHNQLEVIGASLLLSLPLVVALAFIIPSVTGNFLTTQFGISPMIILIVGLYYSVIRHRLFDIRLVVVRSLAYVCVLVSLSIVYYALAYLASVLLFSGKTTETVSISPVNIVLALVLTLIFQPIKQFFDKLTNSLFYREKYNSEEFFAQLSNLLTSTTDLRGLLERASQEVATTFKAGQAFFLLYYANGTSHHMSAGTRHHSRIPMFDAQAIDMFMQNNDGMVFLTESLPENSDIRRLLISHKVALFMPLRHNGRVIGYIFLGEHLSRSYTKRDMKVLGTIANELVIAIQNALSLHEIKEINSTLQQRIDVATKELRSSNSQLRHLDEVKDEFMSMASHQLRTPLTSIKGYLSMVLEEDMGKITPQQRTVLNEAFNSSERMVRLIADFLNVSRLQTGKFVVERNPADVVSVVRSEVESLKMIASTHEMKLAYHTGEKELVMPVDEAKLRQVIMNFIDNSIYYSKPNTTIHVTLERVDNEIAFKVIDTGIGVPKDEQDMLFNKFFRAKNARQQRPDGTGVGLYLAKKVVTAHGGKMIFSSVEGQGSTFGFRIPLPKTTGQ